MTAARWLRQLALGGSAALWLAGLGAAPAAADSAEEWAVGRPLPSIGLSGEPVAMALDRAAGTLYVATAKEPLLAAIDVADRTLLYEAKLPFHPAGLAVSERTHQVFVGAWMGATLSQFDGPSGQPRQSLRVPPSPAAVAIDAATDRVFVASVGSQELTVLDGMTGRVLSTRPLRGTPQCLATNATVRRVYVCDADQDTITTIDADSLEVLGMAPTHRGPSTIVPDRRTGRVYVASAGRGSIDVLSAAGARTATIDLGVHPWGLGLDEAGGRLYVPDRTSGTVLSVDATDGTVKGRQDVGIGAFDVLDDPRDGVVFVAGDGIRGLLALRGGRPAAPPPANPSPWLALALGSVALGLLGAGALQIGGRS